MGAAPHQILVLLSCLVIAAFLFEGLARQTRIPAVLFLLGTGMGLRAFTDFFSWPAPALGGALPLLGMLGLVLIVFEAALDLEIRRDRGILILKYALASLTAVIVTALLVAWFIRAVDGATWKQALINALPLAIISSAVAIPSAAGLKESRREFVVYDSTFSDIIGILVFNLLLTPRAGAWEELVFETGLNLGIVLVLSVVCTVLMGWLLAKSRSHNRLALVLAILVLVFAGGKWAHLPTLLLVFGLGIILNNAHLARKSIAKMGMHLRDLMWELRFLRRVTAEATFMVRSFFFLAFGFSVQFVDFTNPADLAIGAGIYAAILGIRAAILLAFRTPLFPELLLAPRGLITILLFFSIPAAQASPVISKEVVLVVVLASICGMAVGLRFHRETPEPAAPPTLPMELVRSSSPEAGH